MMDLIGEEYYRGFYGRFCWIGVRVDIRVKMSVFKFRCVWGRRGGI